MAEIGDDVVNADRNVRAHFAVALIGQCIFNSLNVGQRRLQLIAARAITHQKREREERLHAEERVVISLVRTDLCIEIASERARDPSRIAAFIIVGQQIARAQAQITRERCIAALDVISRRIEMRVNRHQIVRVRN